jgi:hypothetical protein
MLEQVRDFWTRFVLMIDKQSSTYKFARRVTRIGIWLVGLWAPIKGTYDFLHKGSLAWIGVKVNQDLPHALIYVCWATGQMLTLWAVGALISAVFIFIFVALFTKGQIENPILVSLGVGGIFATLGAIAATFQDGLLLFESTPDSSHFGPWAWVAIGACFLGFVYFRIFTMVQDFLKEIKDEKS